VHGIHHWLVVGEDVKNTSFQQEPEMADGGVGAQQLPVESRVFHLRRREFPGEKGDGTPAAVLELLQDTADM